MLRHTISLLLCAGIGLSGWSLATTMRHPAPAEAEAKLPISPPRPTVSPNQIAERHLFGIPAADIAAAPVTVATNITVEGIIYDSGGTNSIALLSLNSDTQYYATGKALPDGETVTSIEPTAVIVSSGGVRHRLELDIKQADPNARFSTVGVGGGSSSWADDYLDAASTQAVQRASPAPQSRGIALVPAAAPVNSAPPQSLREILAQRSHRFANYANAPLRPTPTPKNPP